MDRDRLEDLARLLAERHSIEAEPQPEQALLNYAETPRIGDWSLRSALVRFAQPEPIRAAAVLELVRRLEAVLHHVARRLERHTVLCDRRLGATPPQEPVAPYPDTRTADLARLARILPAGFPVVLAAYSALVDLEHEEQVALPLLGVALELDDLGEVLAVWATSAEAEPPCVEVDQICRVVKQRLDELGVPTETRPEGHRRPRGRGQGRGRGRSGST